MPKQRFSATSRDFELKTSARPAIRFRIINRGSNQLLSIEYSVDSRSQFCHRIAFCALQEAKGLSAGTVTRLKQPWRGDYKAWWRRCLNKDRWVYMWVDGIYISDGARARGIHAGCLGLHTDYCQRALLVFIATEYRTPINVAIIHINHLSRTLKELRS